MLGNLLLCFNVTQTYKGCFKCSFGCDIRRQLETVNASFSVPKQQNIILFSHSPKQKMCIALEFVSFLTSLVNTRKITLFCPFWINTRIFFIYHFELNLILPKIKKKKQIRILIVDRNRDFSQTWHPETRLLMTSQLTVGFRNQNQKHHRASLVRCSLNVHVTAQHKRVRAANRSFVVPTHSLAAKLRRDRNI